MLQMLGCLRRYMVPSPISADESDYQTVIAMLNAESRQAARPILV